MASIMDFSIWIDSLKKSDKAVIVEGKKDVIALKKHGINKIIKLTTKPLYKLIEEISNTYNEVIILTDLDKEGKKLYKILRHNLQKRKVKVDNKFRKILYDLNITNIESIVNIIP